MTYPILTPSIRLRRTPFSKCVERSGAKAYTVYNHMLLASYFKSPIEDYHHLKTAVQLWDVSVERQVEITGPDATDLVQMTTPRDISSMQDDQCFYMPMVDINGRMMNDPLLLKLDSDRYWISLADSDMLLYCKGLAAGMNLNVQVFEPDVSPLAIQGPKSDELVSRVFGQDVLETSFFRHRMVNVGGTDMVIARSGWSHQGGFELYLDGAHHGENIWNKLMREGKDLDVRAGCPNVIERIESGLLSFGSDITYNHTPFEAGLGKFCDIDAATNFLGLNALKELTQPVRQIRPIELDGSPVPAIDKTWPVFDVDGNQVGNISSSAWSPDFETNVSIGMIDRGYWDEGTLLTAETPTGCYKAKIKERFWN